MLNSLSRSHDQHYFKDSSQNNFLRASFSHQVNFKHTSQHNLLNSSSSSHDQHNFKDTSQNNFLSPTSSSHKVNLKDTSQHNLLNSSSNNDDQHNSKDTLHNNFVSSTSNNHQVNFKDTSQHNLLNSFARMLPNVLGSGQQMDKNSKSTPKFYDVLEVDLNQLVDYLINVEYTKLVDMAYTDEHKLHPNNDCRSDSLQFQHQGNQILLNYSRTLQNDF